MLAKARQILISELALAEKTDEEKASTVLDEVWPPNRTSSRGAPPAHLGIFSSTQ